MKGKFLSNIGFLILLNLLIKGGWILGIDRVVQNTVGAESYGNYYALLNFSFLFSILIDLGITNYNNRRIAQDRSRLGEYLPGLIGLKLLLSFSYLLLVLLVAWILGYSEEQFRLIPILALNQILLSFILYLRSNLGGLHLFRADSVISVLDRSLMILFCSVLLWGLPKGWAFRIEWFVLAQTAAYSLTALIAGGIVLKRAGRIRLNWDSSFFLGILKKSLPYALLVLLMTFYNRVDGVMLERLLSQGRVEAGIYAQGFRILDAVSQFAFLFSTLLLPLFSRAIEKSDGAGLRELLSSSSRLLIPGAIALAVVCCFHALPLMELLYREHQTRSSLVFSVLIVSFIPISLSYIYGTLLTAEGAMKKMNLLAGGGMLLNVLLNFLLIPSYGATGSAIATLSTQAAAAGAQTFIALSHFPMKRDAFPAKRGSLFLLMLVGSGLLFQVSGLPFLFSFILHSLFASGALLLSGLFHLSEGKRMLAGIWSEEEGHK